jgi:hypothetical protein
MLLRTVMVAHKTLDAIDAAIAADGGAAFRVLQGKLMPLALDAYREKEDPHRRHLGASILGRDCAREIWYSFRWVQRGQFEPRMLRLFNRGHLEEPRFVAMLMMIECEFWQHDDQGNQFRISFADDHGGGSGDGVGRGIPDLPPLTAFLAEFKTHGDKSFAKLAGKVEDWRAYRLKRTGPFPGEGVRVAKFEHFVQMQTYMRQMGLAAALYMAVNKNTDDVYAEVVHLDSVFADQFLNRGAQIVPMWEPPKRISDSPGFWKCRFCDKHPVCHMGAKPELNCRTCRYSEPGKAGTWHCTLHKALLDKERQLSGCTDYDVNPSL